VFVRSSHDHPTQRDGDIDLVDPVRGGPRDEQAPVRSWTAHYEDPPPERLDGPAHLEDLRANDRFRFANTLSAWIEVTDGAITAAGQDGGGMIGVTTLAIAGTAATFAAVPYNDIVGEPERQGDAVRFTQTAGGRTGLPTPRRVNRPPFVQLAAPTAWSTVEVTLWADGRHDCRFAGASPFPRHWLYDDSGSLVAKSGTIEYRRWYRSSFGATTPWGNVDTDVVTGQACATPTTARRSCTASIWRSGPARCSGGGGRPAR
jgi:hypothetical protein